jgi:hypothetical protein
MLVPKLGRPVLAGASISAMMIFASGNRPRYLERVVVGVGDGGVNSDKQRFVRGDEAARLPRAGVYCTVDRQAPQDINF